MGIDHEPLELWCDSIGAEDAMLCARQNLQPFSWNILAARNALHFRLTKLMMRAQFRLATSVSLER